MEVSNSLLLSASLYWHILVLLGEWALCIARAKCEHTSADHWTWQPVDRSRLLHNRLYSQHSIYNSATYCIYTFNSYITCASESGSKQLFLDLQCPKKWFYELKRMPRCQVKSIFPKSRPAKRWGSDQMRNSEHTSLNLPSSSPSFAPVINLSNIYIYYIHILPTEAPLTKS